jgi:hypothetical protein
MGQWVVEDAPARIAHGKAAIVDCILRIREVFVQHFDRAWLGVLMDDLPVGVRTLREIRSLILFDSIYPGDEHSIHGGLVELEEFIQALRTYLLPLIRERLGISKLRPSAMVRDRNQYLLRRLLAFTLPYNLERLTALAAELRLRLTEAYPRIDDLDRN